jgi:predicted TIM-barrel fold metal-dependent hydrolase
MAFPRIDIHPHIVSPDTDRYPVSPLGGKRSDWSKSAHSLTAAELIEAMDKAGVAKAALVHSSTTYGFDNSLVVDAVAEFPDRFTAVCSIDALTPDAVETLKSWLDRGCSGLRFFTTGSTMPGQADWLNDPKTYPVWDYAGQVGLPICVQATIGGLAMLCDMMDRFPNVPVLLDHLAKPDLSTGTPYPNASPVLDLAARYPQLVVKFTPSALKLMHEGNASPETFLPLLAEAFGAERIAWGSNYPASAGTLDEIVAKCEAAFGFLSQEDLAKVMGGTALRLYPALAGQGR